jgi:ATP-dependent protease ClpP protease subunit
MSIQWGIKRKRERENDFDLEMDAKRVRMSDIELDLIYTVGNEVYFSAPINKETIAILIKEITKIIHTNKDKFMNEENKLQISYVVDSPGGCVTSILKFVDFLQMQRKKNPYLEFTSIATGLIASAGTIMCAVADKRKMTKNGHAMIHELSSGSHGKYEHLMSYSIFLTSLHKSLLDVYMEIANKSRDEVEKLLRSETWFNAEQYLEYGFVDEII